MAAACALLLLLYNELQEARVSVQTETHDAGRRRQSRAATLGTARKAREAPESIDARGSPPPQAKGTVRRDDL